MAKKEAKEFKRTLARNSLYFFSGLFNALPYSVVRALTRFFIEIGFRCTKHQRKIAKESLQIAFGQEKNEGEINKIIRECFENFGQGMIDLIYFMGHPKMIEEHVFFEGQEHLDQALKEGRGVIAVSAHFGNFPLMLLRFARSGYKTNAIIRQTRDLEVEEYFLNQRRKMGLNTIYSHPRQECVESSIKALRNNEIVFVLLDQNFGSGRGVFVDFFGQKAATATGPVIFAMRTKSVILPIFVVRQKDSRHKVMIDPPFILEDRADEKEMVQVNITRITQIIEQYIRRYPEQWGWMHRRWKTRPQDD